MGRYCNEEYPRLGEESMPVEVGIWRIDDGVKPVSSIGMDYESRLQDIIASDVTIIDPGLMVIGREVETSYGGRIDILAIDSVGNLVVVELKRGQTPRDTVVQALDYASWVRGRSSDEIANIYIDYQRQALKEDSPKGIDDALRERFDSVVPDELNISHRMVIVASELDPSTERIVAYLQEEYGVDINIALFRAFQDGERQYLSRAWLREPDAVVTKVPPGAKGEWNGEFYVSFGESPHRRWNDAKKYGFVGAGGGEWYVNTLRKLQPGNRIWVNIPSKGYVAVGEVTSEVKRYDQFQIELNGNSVPLTQLDLEATGAFDENHGEHFVGVDWIKTVDSDQAVKERGFFGNQNTVAQPRAPNWHFTVERLKTLWGIS